MDNSSDTTTFTNDVTVDRGSMHVEGDILIQHSLGGETEKVVVTGNPAKFRYVLKGDSFPPTGDAIEIVYHSDENKVALRDFTLIDPSGNSQSGINGYLSSRMTSMRDVNDSDILIRAFRHPIRFRI